MRYQVLFLDLDDTILDFHRAERIALTKALQHFGIEATEDTLALYHSINLYCWKQLERGTMTRQEVLEGRFRMLFEQLNLSTDCQACTQQYEGNLAMGHYFLPHAKEAVERLSSKYRLFLASNGTSAVQSSRLTSAGLYPYFEQVFISQELGADKPSREFFWRCFERIPGFDPAEAIMIGDSLTSDVLGGKNAGIATCWVNPSHSLPESSISPDFEIESISCLEAFLETI